MVTLVDKFNHPQSFTQKLFPSHSTDLSNRFHSFRASQCCCLPLVGTRSAERNFLHNKAFFNKFLYLNALIMN